MVSSSAVDAQPASRDDSYVLCFYLPPVHRHHHWDGVVMGDGVLPFLPAWTAAGENGNGAIIIILLIASSPSPPISRPPPAGR